MARMLSKSRLMAWRQCPKRLWLQTYRRDLREIDPAAQARFDAGHRVGEIARELRPGGTLIGHDDDLGLALQETREHLEGTGDRLLFEATLVHGGVLIRADVLDRRSGQCTLVEVKSSTAVKPPHVEDVAIQAWVLQGAGLALERTRLAHIDNTFVYPGNGEYEGLLVEVDLAAEVRPLLEEVPRWVAEAQQVLAGDLPGIDIGAHCSQPYDCEFFGWCSRDEPEYPVSILPRGAALATALRADGLRVADLLEPEPDTTSPAPAARTAIPAIGVGRLNIEDWAVEFSDASRRTPFRAVMKNGTRVPSREVANPAVVS